MIKRIVILNVVVMILTIVDIARAQEKPEWQLGELYSKNEDPKNPNTWVYVIAHDTPTTSTVYVFISDKTLLSKDRRTMFAVQKKEKIIYFIDETGKEAKADLGIASTLPRPTKLTPEQQAIAAEFWGCLKRKGYTIPDTDDVLIRCILDPHYK